MRKPISVKVDLTVGAGYVRYADGTVAGTQDIWQDGWVAADLDESGNVLGIEVLQLDDETLSHARAFAEQHGLAFPQNLAGVVASA